MPNATKSFQNGAIIFVAALAVLSWFGSPFPSDMPLQHIPTAIILAGIFILGRSFRFSNSSFACIMGFLLLHTLGARYIYSYVPYDEWSERLLGKSISTTFGFERNHYDRLVHFGFGLLISFPLAELYGRKNIVAPGWRRFFAVESIAAISMVYELAEWALAVILAPDAADRYLGQQGDIWDSQKDMAFATAGAVISMSLAACVSLIRKNSSADKL